MTIHLGTFEQVPVNVARCPVCAGVDTTQLLHQSSVPTNNAILCDDPAAALGWPVGSFRLNLCGDCGFVFNADLVSVIEFLDIGTRPDWELPLSESE